MERLDLVWRSPGPVSTAYMSDRSEVSCLNGPVGSGKTTTVLMKGITLASEQRPSPRKFYGGVPLRLFKLCVVRDTYRNLWRTTLPSWFKRVPRSIGDWSGGENGPCSHRVSFRRSDSVVELHVDFIAIGDNAVEDVLRGYEPTGFYLNEADLLPWEVFEYASTRWGRYPEREDGGATWSGCLMDCNAPLVGTRFHERVFVSPSPSIKLYRQPGGLDPQAENLPNLPKGYYERMVQYGSEALARRMVHNLPGFSQGGKAVHGEFNDLVHVSPAELRPIPGALLYAGFDAGLDPSMVLGQKLGNGAWQILDEVTSEHGTGAHRFARRVNELLAERYGQWSRSASADQPFGTQGIEIRGYADPSAAWGVDRKEDEESWIDIVARATGIRISAAPTNVTTDRREALRRVLTLMPDGRPAFRLSPRCGKLRSGLAGGFRYRKVALGGGGERWTDEVEKNEFSHVCEALEYMLLGGGEGAEVHERRERGFSDARKLPRSVEEWGLVG